MGYFRELPNLQYLSPLSDRNNSSEYTPAKNIFKRVKLRNDFQNSLTNFDKYQIIDGERPDHVASKIYGSQNLDWVVLISAGITNIRDQWPLSDKDIFEFCDDVYGSDMNAIKFYETKEVKDSKGRIILASGQAVDANFKSPRPKVDSTPLSSYVKFWDSGKETMVTETQVTQSISNYQYEVRENNKKRGIYILKPLYLQQFLNDTRRLMKYGKSSQFVTERIKMTDNIRIKSP